MPDNLSPDDRLRTMRAVKSKGTKPEKRLRAILAGSGLSGWKMNYENAPGKPDIAFPARKIAVFIDGCFWHGCPYCNRPLPETNRAYWEQKIARNIARDQKYDEELQRQGWHVLRIWEHQLKEKSAYQPFLSRLRAALSDRLTARKEEQDGRCQSEDNR